MSSSPSTPGAAVAALATSAPADRLRRSVRWTLAVGYLGVAALGFVAPWQPRVFWTMLLPLLPLAIVLMGFSTWRQICPLALFGEAGRLVRPGVRRRMPPWFESWFLPIPLLVLYAMLVLRLVATNGDGRWLGGLLIALALAAAAVNAKWSGKTWCNFFCPVGVVERIYTDPGSLRQGPGSQCARCTACKRHCPDIDQENAYWKDALGRGRRLAFYAFPGLVLAFYLYYFLRHGDWEAYFDGRWTRHPASAELAFGPGFFFAPGVPAVWAAILTLGGLAAASYLAFAAVEAVIARRVEDPERRRHLVLAVAAFAAWNLFYLFAGAPTLLRLPYGTRSLAFAAPFVGTLVLAKRWRRTRERYIAEQGARRLLRNWEFEEPPPRDAAEVYGWIKASRLAHEKELQAYANTVRDIMSDGLVGPGELRLLEGVRRQLGISEREHEKILARLSEEERDLFSRGGDFGVERRLQLEGFESALAEALVRNASQAEIEELRASFGIGREEHTRALERLRGAGGPLLSRARRQLDRALELRRSQAAIGATDPTAARVFLCSLLAKARDEALERVLELLEAAGDGPMIQVLRRRLFSADPAERALALELLGAACPGAEELAAELEPLLARRPPPPEELAGEREPEVLAALVENPDPYLRAAAVWAAATGERSGALAQALERAFEDGHALVRETALWFGRPREAERPGGLPRVLSMIETMHLLHAVPLFGGLDPEDLHELALYAFEETIPPESSIFERGEADADALWVLLEGRVRIERGEEPGAGAEVGGGPARHAATARAEVLAPGAVIGELSVLDGSRRDATARPQGGPARVLRIPGASFRGRLLRRPRVTEWMLAALAGRIRRLSERG